MRHSITNYKLTSTCTIVVENDVKSSKSENNRWWWLCMGFGETIMREKECVASCKSTGDFFIEMS